MATDSETATTRIAKLEAAERERDRLAALAGCPDRAGLDPERGVCAQCGEGFYVGEGGGGFVVDGKDEMCHFECLGNLWHGRAETLRVALRGLVTKLDAVNASDEWRGIWSFLYIHGWRYAGPNYGVELRAAHMVLGDPGEPDESQ